METTGKTRRCLNWEALIEGASQSFLYNCGERFHAPPRYRLHGGNEEEPRKMVLAKTN